MSLLFFIPGMVQASTESYLAGKGSTPVITAKTVADHLAAKLNAKLNYQPNEADAPPDVDKEVRFLNSMIKSASKIQNFGQSPYTKDYHSTRDNTTE